MPADDIQNKRFTKIYLTLWGVCLLVALVIFTFYKLGFRLSSRFQPVKAGSVELLSNEAGAQIFFDNHEKQIPFQDGRYHIEKVSPGLHSVMLSKQGFWPWAKTINVTADARRSVFAFIFKMGGLPTKPVLSGSAEYADASRGVRQNVVPRVKPYGKTFHPDDSFNLWLEENVPDRKLSYDKSTVLFTENDTIYIGWVSETDPPPHYFCEENPCKLKLPVTVSLETVKSLDFYKGRGDVILFAAGSAIYAIETDRESTQNFQPLYKGTDPYFYESPDGTLYIKDGNSILTTNI